MPKLWIKFGNKNPTQVSTKECNNIDDFLKACKKKLPNRLGSYDPDQLTLSTTHQETTFCPSFLLADLRTLPGYQNDDLNPLIINVISSTSETAIVTENFHPQKFKRIKKFLFRTNEYTCLTLFQKSQVVTFAHSPHDKWKLNEEIVITPVVDGDIPYLVEVVYIDRETDIIILKSKYGDLCTQEPILTLPSYGEEYIQFGISAIAQLESPLSLSKGIITSLNFDKNGHILGSAGSNPGDSGGGCFCEWSGMLFGINVGNESIPFHGNTTLLQLGTRYPARSYIVPSIYFRVSHLKN